MSGLRFITVRQLIDDTSRGASFRVVSRTMVVSFAVFARVLLIYHMTVLVVIDSHLLQISDERLPLRAPILGPQTAD
jgi:hypothetical protein